MTREEMLCLIATIWIAPHASKKYAIIVVWLFLIYAALFAFGVFK